VGAASGAAIRVANEGAAKPALAAAATAARQRSVVAGFAKASAHSPVRLKAACGPAVRRLGVPLRGGLAGSRKKRLRSAAGVGDGSFTVVKQQPASDDEEEAQGSQAVPDAEIPRSKDVGMGATDSQNGRVRQVTARLNGWPDPADVRGRKIVGTLMGHLASAKKQLAEEGKPKKARRKATGSHEGTKRHERCTEEEQDIDRAIQEKEMLLLQQRLEGHYMHMKNFIRTKVEPTIFYLPVKHTPETERFLEETRRAIEQKIRSLKTHLQCPAEEPRAGGRHAVSSESEEEEQAASAESQHSEEADEDEEEEEEEEEAEAEEAEGEEEEEAEEAEEVEDAEEEEQSSTEEEASEEEEAKATVRGRRRSTKSSGKPR